MIFLSLRELSTSVLVPSRLRRLHDARHGSARRDGSRTVRGGEQGVLVRGKGIDPSHQNLRSRPVRVMKTTGDESSLRLC